jgi:ABC-type phosphate/phosphonate transport system substrate-binding protein
MITSFRMYDVAPRASQAWRALFERAFAEAGADIRVIEHRWPEPIDDLWGRPDLCCAFMCGWPFVQTGAALQAIAAPVPSPPRYEGLPRYCSEFLVREASGWQSLEETFGHRFGWMAMNSQSGFNAPRAYLARFTTRDRRALYAEVRGPLGTPGRTLDALRASEVDVVALDGYFLDLCRHHAPAKLAGLRCIATTPWTPIPLLVAAPAVDEALVARLRQHLLSLQEHPAYVPLLADVLLARFAAPDVESYCELESIAREAATVEYDVIR